MNRNSTGQLPVALITGVLGQDGAYLSKLLLDQGYKVIGGYRRTTDINPWRLKYLNVLEHPNLQLVELDLLDQGSLITVLDDYRPSEIYNLAAQSFVGVSFKQPILTSQVTGLGVVNLLEAIRIVDPSAKFYQASTSELFGLVQSMPQNELTPFYPRSPYGVAKLFAHWATINYRESYGIHACCGILFNHESPLRGVEFVTRKITLGVADIVVNGKGPIRLGNLDAVRDWGHAEDYVRGMHSMMLHSTPDVFVLSTGRTVSVREFTALAFAAAGREIEFIGSGLDEYGVDSKTGEILLEVDPKFYRPAEVDLLVGDNTKAKTLLGWQPKVSVEDLVASMVLADIERAGE